MLSALSMISGFVEWMHLVREFHACGSVLLFLLRFVLCFVVASPRGFASSF